MRVLVCGGRDFRAQDLLFRVLDELQPQPTLIIEGGQRTYDDDHKIIGGADFFARLWALSKSVPVRTVVADWSDLITPPVAIKTNRNGVRYNACAGGIRNQKMIDQWHPELVIAAPGRNGTADMIRRAGAAKIEVRRLTVV